ncbi:hypothetical protein [Sinomonas mesophila]|uniref:hypothetical protein n=1 Tax=Sinomonas mesophila TaxID=1531955 RepID=UPI000987A849|nr:hypothetical protein [Sinomonas mesophila]
MPVPRPARSLRALAGAGAVALAAAAFSTAPAFAGEAPGPRGSEESLSFAVIGDVPYGAPDVETFPAKVADINADASLGFAVHVGDIKNGSSECTDAYFARIRADFDAFAMPLVYTPGDNEWTDCHRVNNGAYNPLERLGALREVFFDEPGKTLGATMPVRSQAERGLPENVSFGTQRVAFAAVHIVGSNNSTLPWTGLGETEPTAQQFAEVADRTEAGLALLRETFAAAKQRQDRAVVVFTQADMFDPGYQDGWPIDAFTPFVQALVDEATAFGGPVYLVDGDSHVYHEDSPLAPGSEWLARYGVTGSAANLHRVTVEGAAGVDSWLRFSVAPNAGRDEDVVTWSHVAYTG